MPEIDLQLLPERKKKIDIYTPGKNKSLMGAAAILILVIAAYAVLYFYKSSVMTSIQTTENQLADIERARNTETETRLLAIQKKMSLASSLLDSHIYWSEAFNKIQSITHPQVQFKSLNGNTSDKKLTITASAPNYPVIANQISSILKEKSVTDFSLDRVVSLPTGRIEFNLRINFDPAKFLVKPKI